MYGASGQEASMANSSDHGWEQIGDWTSSRGTPNSAAECRRKRYRYRVSGFGCHTEYKTIEFLEELFATRFCCWCGLVAGEMYILSCLHVICPTCQERAFSLTSGFAVCLVDKEMLSIDAIAIMPNNVHFKLVRCPSQGCDHVGYLKDLNYHLGRGCAFNLTTCSKCNGSVAHKDMPHHFWTCEGTTGVFLHAADVHSLLEDLDNARKELDSAALCSASASVLENVVVTVTEVFDRINGHLVMETPACSRPGPDGADPAK